MNTEKKKIGSEQEIEGLWDLLAQRQGETFYTAKKLPFQYVIRGGEMFVDRRSRSITKATFANALEKLRERPDEIKGPKTLNVFGAPYVWALLVSLGIVEAPAKKEKGGSAKAEE